MGITIEANGVTVSDAAPYPVKQQAVENAGFTGVMCESDDGSITGERATFAVEATEDWRQRIGLDTLLQTYAFSGTVVDTSSAPTTVATMTAAQGVPAGFLVLNAGNSLAAAAVARMTTQQVFQTQSGAGLSIRIHAQSPFVHVVNAQVIWGRMLVTGTSDPTDGQFFRYNAAGGFEAVATFNGVPNSVTIDDTSTAARVALTAPDITHKYAIDVYSDKTVFWIDNIRVAKILAPPGQSYIESAVGLPISARCLNVGATAQAQQLKVAGIQVLLQDVASTRRIDQQQIAGGLSMMQYPPNGAAAGPMITHANLAAPGLGTLSNTALPIAAHNMMTGDFLVTLSGLTLATDYILNAFQVPVAAANAGGRLAMISGLHFDCELAGAANAATIQNYELLLFVGSTTLTLVTVADAASGVKCPRRLPVARLSFPASAAIGTTLNVDVTFDGHVPVNPGEFMHVVLKPTFYTTVASQTLRYSLRTDGCFY